MTAVTGTAWLDQMLDEYWTDATVHAYLLADDALFSPTIDMHLSDIPGGDRLVGPTVVTGKLNLGGFFTDDPVPFVLDEGDVAAWLIYVLIGVDEESSPIVGSTNVYGDNTPLGSVVGNGGVVEFYVQPQGLGRI
jgi:hypothetical protein